MGYFLKWTPLPVMNNINRREEALARRDCNPHTIDFCNQRGDTFGDELHKNNLSMIIMVF